MAIGTTRVYSGIGVSMDRAEVGDTVYRFILDYQLEDSMRPALYIRVNDPKSVFFEQIFVAMVQVSVPEEAENGEMLWKVTGDTDRYLTKVAGSPFVAHAYTDVGRFISHFLDVLEEAWRQKQQQGKSYDSEGQQVSE